MDQRLVFQLYTIRQFQFEMGGKTHDDPDTLLEPLSSKLYIRELMAQFGVDLAAIQAQVRGNVENALALHHPHRGHLARA